MALLYFYVRSDLGSFDFVLRDAPHGGCAFCREIRAMNVLATTRFVVGSNNHDFGRLNDRSI